MFDVESLPGLNANNHLYVMTDNQWSDVAVA